MGWGGGAGYRPRVRKAYSDNHLLPYPPDGGDYQYRAARGVTEEASSKMWRRGHDAIPKI